MAQEQNWATQSRTKLGNAIKAFLSRESELNPRTKTNQQERTTSQGLEPAVAKPKPAMASSSMASKSTPKRQADRAKSTSTAKTGLLKRAHLGAMRDRRTCGEKENRKLCQIRARANPPVGGLMMGGPRAGRAPTARTASSEWEPGFTNSLNFDEMRLNWLRSEF
jgi:hypothetical protein